MSSYDLGALLGLVEEKSYLKAEEPLKESDKDELTQLSEIFVPSELEVLKAFGGQMHRAPLQANTNITPFERRDASHGQPDIAKSDLGHSRQNSKNRVVIRDGDSQKSVHISGDDEDSAGQLTSASLSLHHNGRLTGVYEHYLLVRPYPSLRILFTSPSMRVPGILQSPLLDRIGGSPRIREQLVQALAAGQGVTARVKWLNKSRRGGNKPTQKKINVNHPLEAHLEAGDDLDTVTEEEIGRPRWLHCTPLAGAENKVGVWMIVIVDDEDSSSRLKPAVAPPIQARAQAPPSRPNSGMSDRSQASTFDDGMFVIHNESTAPEMRPRRSSETLGYQRSDLYGLSSKKETGSVTHSIHNQHSSNAQRTPKTFLKNSIPASKFFSLDALSRTAAGNRTKEKPASRKSARSSVPSFSVFPRPEAPLPPWPLRSDSKSAPKKQQEKKPRIVSMIPEEVSVKSSESPKAKEEDEVSSLHSRGSAFTVKIEEE